MLVMHFLFFSMLPEPPPHCNLASFLDGLEVHLVLPPLCLQVFHEVLMGREGHVVLQVVSEAQDGVYAARPLPPCMDALCIQHVVRSQKKPRSQELEEGLILALAVPQKASRHCF